VLTSRSLKSVSVHDCDCNAGILDPFNSPLIIVTPYFLKIQFESHTSVIMMKNTKHIERGGGGGEIRRSVCGFAKS